MTLNYMMHFPSTKLYDVNLPPYYNYNVQNMTFFRPDFSYTRGSQCAYVERSMHISRFICDLVLWNMQGTLGTLCRVFKIHAYVSSLCIQIDILH